MKRVLEEVTKQHRIEARLALEQKSAETRAAEERCRQLQAALAERDQSLSDLTARYSKIEIRIREAEKEVASAKRETLWRKEDADV